MREFKFRDTIKEAYREELHTQILEGVERVKKEGNTINILDSKIKELSKEIKETEEIQSIKREYLNTLLELKRSKESNIEEVGNSIDLASLLLELVELS